MKYILVIGDGMADNALPELLGKTPLEYAKTPTLDALAAAGVMGTVRTIPDEVPAGSDTAILSILGCDPSLHYGGRAALEAAASYIEIEPGDVAYRCNMVTFEDADKPFEQLKLLSHSAGGIGAEESDALVTELFDSPDFSAAAQAAGMEIYPSGSFRHIAVQRERQIENLAPPLLPLTPPHDHIGEPLGSLLPQGDKSARILSGLTRLAHGFLKGHEINKRRRREGKMPANGIWFWAEGRTMVLPDFECKYGKKGYIISAVPLCRGIGALMGLEQVIVEGATGELNTNYEGKVAAAVDLLETCDFVTVHIEAPDECSHNGDIKGKVQAIEWIDSRVAAPLVRHMREGGTRFRMLVISDHKTLISTRGHNGDPVPFILYDSGAGHGGSGAVFCESSAEKGIFVPHGTSLMGMLFDETETRR